MSSSLGAGSGDVTSPGGNKPAVDPRTAALRISDKTPSATASAPAAAGTTESTVPRSGSHDSMPRLGGYIGAGVLREYQEEYGIPVAAAPSGTSFMTRSRTYGDVASMRDGADTRGWRMPVPVHPSTTRSPLLSSFSAGRRPGDTPSNHAASHGPPSLKLAATAAETPAMSPAYSDGESTVGISMDTPAVPMTAMPAVASPPQAQLLHSALRGMRAPPLR